MGSYYVSLDNSSKELHTILKEYSLNTQLGEDNEFRTYLIEFLVENRQRKSMMLEAESRFFEA